MGNNWRSNLEEYIMAYTTSPGEWYEISSSPSGTVSITLVSDKLAGMSGPERRKLIEEFCKRCSVPMRLGFLSLYTTEEAQRIGLQKLDVEVEALPLSWHDAAHWAASEHPKASSRKRNAGIPRTVVFYSYKGGVGRTTALVHVAYQLAIRGRKVVAVDLDLEAPGLGDTLHLEPQPQKGLIDYFYERAYLPEGVQPTISVADILGEVRIDDAKGRLFVVPAGRVGLSYLTKVDDLRSDTVTSQGVDLWTTFAEEIGKHLDPDVILVDSRTGINEWGAFSLFRAADQVVAFLYPNDQNLSGGLLLRDLVEAKGTAIHFVFSPVPVADGAGYDKVQSYWNQLVMARTDAELEDSEEAESGQEQPEPLVLPYVPAIALADKYPVVGLLSYYSKIANLIDDDTTAAKLADLLMGVDRWRILDDLSFPMVDATDPRHDLRNLFQRTADFDRFLDQNTSLIRGRKGTGKSALYWLLLKHNQTARELARGRLDHVVCHSGHGRFRIRPTRDEFSEIDKALATEGGSWEAFWRGYLVLRLFLDGRSLPRGRNYSPLRNLLKPGLRTARWKIEHTRALIQLATSAELKLLVKDVLYDIDDQQKDCKTHLWFLYDDLDEDIPDADGLRQRALSGLFQMVQDADARRLNWIHFKIFLREDIWSRLVFDNKSHFNGRDLLLQWSRTDFMRLALRQTLQSREYQELVQRFAPVDSIDQADEETIESALQLLWGSRRERGRRSKYVSRWVYERLTDASGTTFPRSLNELLRAARDHELQYRGQTVAHPSDRLLRAQSLNQGLVAASNQRCAEMREEYPELIPFFDVLNEVPAVASEKDIERAWSRSAMHVSPSFSDFVELLQSIGLVSRVNDQYRFAHIFVHGFNMPREGRKF